LVSDLSRTRPYRTCDRLEQLAHLKRLAHHAGSEDLQLWSFTPHQGVVSRAHEYGDRGIASFAAKGQRQSPRIGAIELQIEDEQIQTDPRHVTHAKHMPPEGDLEPSSTSTSRITSPTATTSSMIRMRDGETVTDGGATSFPVCLKCRREMSVAPREEGQSRLKPFGAGGLTPMDDDDGQRQAGSRRALL
jgi:hypothetical protein